MSVSDPWYISERAEHLAIVNITRHPRATVIRSPVDQGVDLLVSLGRPGRLLGIEVKGAASMRKLIGRDGLLRPKLLEQVMRTIREYPFPVVIMLFDMSNDEGFFAWLLEPILENVWLRPITRPRAEPLTHEQFGQAISRVERWYEERKHATT